MKTIYINGRFMTQKITGVQRYAIEILHAIDDLIEENKELKKYRYVVLVPRGVKEEVYKYKNISIRKIGMLKGHAWEQIELPWFSRKGFLINLCNCAPLIKKRQCVTIHDAAIAACPKAYNRMFRIWYNVMYYILGSRLNLIFTVSNFSRNELIKYFKIDEWKLKVTYNGSDHIQHIEKDVKVFDKFDIISGEYIFAVSSMNPSKNFKLIIDVAEKMPEINFVIAGGNNLDVFPCETHRSLDNVKFIGYVSDAELMALYDGAACFVCPSLYEGFGIPPLEAMVAGCKRILLSDIPVFRELYGQDAVFFSVVSESDLISKIRQCLLVKEPKIKDGIQYRWADSARELIKYVMQEI